jgi:hypothetical protein
MVELLSQKIGVGSFSICAKSFKSLLIHTIWHDVEVAATYSTFVEDIATMGCFFDVREIRLVPK